MPKDIQFRHYFVDEAGDLSFFNKKGRIIVGQPGASKFFMVGVAQIADPEAVAWELNALRSSLMTHPRYKGIPSMQPQAKKALPDLWLKLYWMIHFAFLAFAEGLAVPRY
jgi:hypothetical protein